MAPSYFALSVKSNWIISFKFYETKINYTKFLIIYYIINYINQIYTNHYFKLIFLIILLLLFIGGNKK